MRETWVRPPVVAVEPPNPRIAVWRYRLVGLLLLAVLAVLAGWLFLRISGVAAEDPGLGGALAPVTLTALS